MKSIKRSVLLNMIVLVLLLTLAYSSKTMIKDHYRFDRRQDKCEEKGFGFDGYHLKRVAETLEKIVSAKDKIPDFLGLENIKALLEKAGPIVTSFVDGAIGDFKTDEVAKFSSMSCDVIPWDKNITIGVLAISLKNIPCSTAPIQACAMFSRCGSVAFAMNSGVPQCIATATGIGAAVAPLLGALSGVGIAYSHNNRIPLDVSIAAYNSTTNKFEEKTFTIKGNIFFRLQVSLTSIIIPDTVQIAGKKVNDILSIKGEGNIIVDYGKVFSTIKSQVEQTLKGAKKDSLIKELGKSGAETAVEVNAELGLNLKDLTKSFLPDITVAKTKINAVASLGNGNSGIKKGLYLAVVCEITLFKEFFNAIMDTVKKILGFLGIKVPDLDLSLKAHLGLSVTDEAIGVRIGGAFGSSNGDLNCLYKLSDGTFSCEALKAFFHAVINGAEIVVQKATDFFKAVGKTFKGALKKIKDFFTISNLIETNSAFFNERSFKKKGDRCPKGHDEIDGRCYKQNINRNYYKLYLKMMKFKRRQRRLAKKY